MSAYVDRIGAMDRARRLRRIAAFADVRAAPYLYIALLALMTAPALLYPIPNAADIVNHWARLTILRMSADDPLAKLYAVKFAIIPNLGVDLLYVALGPVMSAQSVARLAWALALWLPAWGAWRLHRAWFGTPQLAILLIPLISYNLVVTVGLVNYGIGIGVALLALAWEANSTHRVLARLIVINLVAVVLLFCHVLALLAFCVALGLRRLTPEKGDWRAALGQAVRTPAFVAVALALLALAERTPAGFQLTGDKSLAFAAPFLALTDYDNWLRFVVILFLGIGAATRHLSVAPNVRLALAVLAAMIAVMPSAWGAGNLLDARLAVFWAYLAIPALQWHWAGRGARLVVAIIVALSIARVASVLPGWALFQREAGAMREAFAAIPPGARVLVVKPHAQSCHDPEMPMLNNLTAFIVIDRRAAVNTLFADPGMQPVRPIDPALQAAPKMAMSSGWLTPEGRQSMGALLGFPWASAFVNWRDHFDTVVSLHGRCDGRLDAPGLKPVAVSTVADVYRAQ